MNLSFIANELLLVIKNKINIVTRSRDKTSSQYLLELKKHQLIMVLFYTTNLLAK